MVIPQPLSFTLGNVRHYSFDYTCAVHYITLNIFAMDTITYISHLFNKFAIDRVTFICTVGNNMQVSYVDYVTVKYLSIKDME